MATPFIDFKQLKASVSMQQVMEHTGLPFKKVKGSEYRCECPVHKGGKRTLVVNTAVLDEQGCAGVFSCHGDDGKGGDSIALIAHIRQGRQYAAAKELHDHFCPDMREASPSPATVPEEKEETSKGGRGFQPLPYISHADPSVEALGFDPAIAEALGLGHCPRGFHRGRIAIPLRLADGKLAGYLSIKPGTSVKLPDQWHL